MALQNIFEGNIDCVDDLRDPKKAGEGTGQTPGRVCSGVKVRRPVKFYQQQKVARRFTRRLQDSARCCSTFRAATLKHFSLTVARPTKNKVQPFIFHDDFEGPSSAFCGLCSLNLVKVLK